MKKTKLPFIENQRQILLPDWKSEVSDEMKNQGREYLASMGIYVFNKKVLKKCLKKIR